MPRTGRPVGSTCALCGVSAGRERLIALRIALHGSQARLAAALTAARVPTTARAVSGWERGEYHPGEEKLPTLARVLRVSQRRLEAWLWPVWGSERQAEIRLPKGAYPLVVVPSLLPATSSATAHAGASHPTHARELSPGLAPAVGAP